MKNNSKNNSQKDPKIPLTRISWEPDVTEKLEAWIRETAAGRFQDLTSEVEAWFEVKLNRPCIAVSSGTAALHLALRQLDLKHQAEIIMPTLTYAACANVVLYEGLKPVFCDVNYETWCLDAEKLSKTISNRLQSGAEIGAVMLVHLYGQFCPMQAIQEVCNQYGIPIIEDVAQALGGKESEKPLGSLGDYACFSFNANKILSGMGGGLLALKTQEEKEEIRNLIRHGRMPFENGLAHYKHHTLGFNYQMSGYTSALIQFQLPHLDERLHKKHQVFDKYHQQLSSVHRFKNQGYLSSENNTRWMSCFEINQDKGNQDSRDDLCRHLWRKGIEARPVFRPLHQQTAFTGQVAMDSKTAEQIAQTGICLPSSCDLQPDEQDKVIATIGKCLEG
ncbi:DegT/DnrJ/EryC1/StrS family aminotransferase [bacterium]|nr:DegT/DnrJ/EryC1/StrS family aminotransferase [bacterium]